MGQKQKTSQKKSTNRKRQKKTHNSAGMIAQLGMFIAVAMVFSYIESFIRIDIAVPGIKIGLANIVTIVVLCKLGLADAVLVSALRIFLSSLLFGNFTVMIYSLAGAAVSMLLCGSPLNSDSFQQRERVFLEVSDIMSVSLSLHIW